MNIAENIKYIGVNDKDIDLFESQYPIPDGISYNSYAILDEKIAILDTVDARFSDEWIKNISKILGEKTPDYLIIHHMEPDHSANIELFCQKYPNAKLVASNKSFSMMEQFFNKSFEDKKIVVADNSELSLGRHTLSFITAPMIHWPEVIMSYDNIDKILFSADAFGKFGITETEENWTDEARRYYFGIVGKYGIQVQNLLNKIAKLEIKKICSLHGPILEKNLENYINLYKIWSSYEPEENGTTIAYTSIYGNTKKAVIELAEKLKSKGENVVLYNLARCDMTKAVSDAFKYNKLVLATPTYNADIFPFMKTFINHLIDRNFQNRTVAMIENGSWAPIAIKTMCKMFENSKNITFTKTNITIKSALNSENEKQLNELQNEL